MILHGDCLETLKTLEAGIVQTCVTSPPYYGLRDYGTAKWAGGDIACDHAVPVGRKGGNAVGTKQTTNAGSYGYREWLVCGKCGAKRIDSQIGLEETPEAYVQKLVQVFREVKRVLKDDGTLWLNLGDSYNGTKNGNTNGTYANGVEDKSKVYAKTDSFTKTMWAGAKVKDLLGIPWMVAFALRADGWYLRQDIIWAKPNPMPESVKDRCTKSHEYIFLLSKSQKYFYDYEAIKEPSVDPESFTGRRKRNPRQADLTGDKFLVQNIAKLDGNIYETRNKRDVWTITTRPYKGAHFATFPPKLIEPCILAGSRKGDTVLDPFNGSGTTGQVALEHGRDYIGCELNADYIKLTEERLDKVQVQLG